MAGSINVHQLTPRQVCNMCLNSQITKFGWPGQMIIVVNGEVIHNKIESFIIDEQKPKSLKGKSE